MSIIKTNEFQGSGLELARCAKGFDFDDLERATGIDKRRCAKIESGIDYPSDSEISLLAIALGVLPHFFNGAWVKPPEHSVNIKWSK